MKLILKLFPSITFISLLTQISVNAVVTDQPWLSFDQSTRIPRPTVYEMLKDPDLSKVYHAASYILTYRIDKGLNPYISICGATFTLNMNSGRLHSAAVSTYEQQVNDLDLAYLALYLMAENISNPFAYNAALRFWYSDRENEENKDKEFARLIFKAMAQDIEHKNAFDAAMILWNSSVATDKEVGCVALHAIAKNTHHKNAFDAAKELLRSSIPEDNKAGRLALHHIIKTMDHTKAYDSILLLLQSDLEKSRTFLSIFFCNSEHLKIYDFACKLWSERSGTFREFVRITFQNVVCDIYHPKAYDAAKILYSSDVARDKENGRVALYGMANDLDHQKVYHAAITLYNSTCNEDKSVGLADLRCIASNPNHPKECDAAIVLYDSPSDKDKEIWLSVIRSVARKQEHPNAYGAALKLREIVEETDRKFSYAAALIRTWWSSDSDEGDASIARSTLFFIAKKALHDSNFPNAINAVNELKNSKNEDDKLIVRPLIRAIFQNIRHPLFFSVATVVLKTNILEDKSRVLALLNDIVSNTQNDDCAREMRKRAIAILHSNRDG
ncbi:MAG: hypothetical protein V4544_07075 [Pseudomonadota bacterium]